MRLASEAIQVWGSIWTMGRTRRRPPSLTVCRLCPEYARIEGSCKSQGRLSGSICPRLLSGLLWRDFLVRQGDVYTPLPVVPLATEVEEQAHDERRDHIGVGVVIPRKAGDDRRGSPNLR